ncbi:MAG TPA: L-lactate dehydrogenase [Vicinamibacteria bacterium]|nr:L-lactate dehydrogenase [Vicinamibacteria bacterium]
MSAPPVSSRKVAIVGTGMVGATFAYALLQRGLASEIVLVDREKERAEGEAMDLSHGLAFVPPVRVRAGDWADIRGSAVVALTAGASQKPGQTRLDLLQANAAVCRELVPRIVEAEPAATIVIATNPVDILTHLAAEVSGLPWGRVIGSGTTLDSARFRYLLGSHFGVDPRSVHAYVIGEHGDTAVPVWSTAAVGGVPLDALPRPEGRPWDDATRRRLFEETRTAAYEIIRRKRATCYAIGLALLAVVETVLRDQRTILTVSLPVRGAHGIRDIALSLPAIVGRGGATEVLPLPLSPDEEAALVHSARALRARLDAL